MQFSDDGSTLLVASLTQDVLIYDVVGVVRLGHPIRGDAPFANNGFLRSDGRELAVTDRFGVQIWDIDTGSMSAAACRVAGRNLTEVEWTTYFPSEPYRRTCDQHA